MTAIRFAAKGLLLLAGVIVGASLSRWVPSDIVVGSPAFLPVNTTLVLVAAAAMWILLPWAKPLCIGLASGALAYTLFVAVIIVLVGFIP
jgi:hypothetical protein